jgi:threonine dehydratase
LSELLKADVYVKHENHQPTGSFKVRGQINVISKLDQEARKRGVIMASTGNDGQAMAYAANLFGLASTVIMPQGANPTKVKMTKSLGASVIFHGDGFEEAKRFAEELAREKGYTYVHSANEPRLIAGAATLMLEVAGQLPALDTVIVPVGGGACASGVCLVAKWLDRKSVRVIGVQSSAAPAAYRSWKRRGIVTAENRTMAEGLAVGSGYELPQQVLWRMLDDFVLVSDAEILDSMRLMIEHTRNLVEPASAATYSAAEKRRRGIAGRKVVLVLTGGNASMEQLRMAISGSNVPRASTRTRT